MIKKRGFYIFMFIFWMFVIFFFSSIPGLKSDLPSKYDFIFRKLSHFTEYFVLMFFALRIFAHEELRGKKFDYKVLFCFIIVFLYAASDEFHQAFVVSRHFAITDILIDFSGGVVCYLSLRFLDRKISLK